MKRPTITNGIVTADGYLVPPSKIPNCRRIVVPAEVWDYIAFKQEQSTSIKGQKAMSIVKWLLKKGLFPLWATPTVIDDLDIQYEGTDIIVKMMARIQVKCDFAGGEGRGCTGNLYLQVAECNPHREF